MKFYIHKLGCPKNDVDADYIAARLIDAGHRAVTQPEAADSVIVNTCGFIQAAKEESINELLRLGQLKTSGDVKTLYATGCLSQRYGDEMLKEMPELDGAFGHGALDSLARALGGSEHLDRAVRLEPRKLGYLTWKHRFISDSLPYSYVKISDGCDRMCTYCAIPSMRGRFRSRPIDSILNEARFLAAHGKKELILVSQEATLYGFDLPGRPSVIDLLRALEDVDGIEWLRLMYLHPAALTHELIDYMAADNKTLNYYDLPLQHISTRVLQRMHRQVDRPQIESLLRRIREVSDDAVLRTTFIVGFPGETQAHFEELRDAVTEFRFDRMGVFTYSPEEGTPAEKMPGRVSAREMTRRQDVLMQLQREIAFARNESLLGTLQQVIIDSPGNGKGAIGRTRADCPEIDQEVFVTGDNVTGDNVTGDDVPVGDFCRVRIDACDGYDLTGCMVRE